jgi:hypothetical protein
MANQPKLTSGRVWEALRNCTNYRKPPKKLRAGHWRELCQQVADSSGKVETVILDKLAGWKSGDDVTIAHRALEAAISKALADIFPGGPIKTAQQFADRVVEIATREAA